MPWDVSEHYGGAMTEAETAEATEDLLRRMGGLRQRLAEEDVELQAVRATLLETRITAAFLGEVLERTRADDHERLAAIATVALREVFVDRQFTVLLRGLRYRGRPGVRIVLRDEETGVEGEPLRTFGGGVGAVLGLVFRVLTVLRHPRLARVLLLDEPLTAASLEYQAAIARMLSSLCRNLGFRMLVVTHLEGLADGADQHYRCERAAGSTRVELVRAAHQQLAATPADPAVDAPVGPAVAVPDAAGAGGGGDCLPPAGMVEEVTDGR